MSTCRYRAVPFIIIEAMFAANFVWQIFLNTAIIFTKSRFQICRYKVRSLCFQELDVLSGWLEASPGAGNSFLGESDKK
jgi:hypothetical protein